jgi:hypothetical protein
MKKNYFLRIFISTIFFIVLQSAKAQEYASNNSIYENNSEISNENKINQTVYICTGNYSYAYHSVSNCPGLGNCKGEIKYTDEYSAVNSFERKPCCRCWKNVTNNCKDDFANYSGGGGGSNSDGSGEAVLAILLVSASVAILSNDVYVYPTYSFYKDPNFSNLKPSKIGWSFGFRKTFKKSALEYGASIQTFEESYNYSYNYNYNSFIEQKKWGFHLNYVHDVFKSKMPDNIISYVGPTINYYNEIGYGIIIGAKYKLLERLNLDCRYEISSQTNQFQIGLIFNYQRKYFWKK